MKPTNTPKKHSKFIGAGFRPLDKAAIPGNMIAGITLAAVSIPTVIGYAKLAQTPIITGIYTMLLPIVIFALVGSSKHLVIGADSASAVIMAQGLAAFASVSSASYMNYVLQLTFVTGVLLLICRILRLGFIAKFLSRTVLVGFLTGVGIQVAITQLVDMMGIATTTGNIFHQILYPFRQIHNANKYALLLSGMILIFIFLPKIIATKIAFLRKIPWAFIAIVIAIALSYRFQLSSVISTIGTVPHGLPHFVLPSFAWGDIMQVLPISLTIVLVIITQSSATSLVYANRYQEEYRANSDIVALGLANISAALTGTFVVAGSPTKTAILEDAGGTNQIAHLTSVGAVALVLIFLTGPLSYLPTAALAALVFGIGIELIDFRSLKKLFKEKRNEWLIAMLTAAVVVLVGVSYGMIFAIALAMSEHIYRGTKLKNFLIVPETADTPELKATNDSWIWVPVETYQVAKPHLVIYHFAAPFFYGNTDGFTADVLNIVKKVTDLKFLVLDFTAIPDVDFTAGQVLLEMHHQLQCKGITLQLVYVDEDAEKLLTKYGVIEVVGKNNIFPNYQSTVNQVER